MKQDLMFQPVVFGFSTPILPISRQIAARMSRYEQKGEEKRAYSERVLQEHGTFTPLVFSIYGSMDRES